MLSHSEVPGIWLSVWRFLLTHCLYERAAKVLARLRGCAGSPEPSLLAKAISTKFAWRGPNHPSNRHAQPSSGARCLIFGRHFVYFHISCVWTAKALATLCRCTGSPEPSLVAYVISTIISNYCKIGSNYCKMVSLVSSESVYELQHDKTNKMTCEPSEDSDQPGHPPSLRCALNGRFLHMNSKDSDQTVWMPRLIWVFAVHSMGS